MTLVIMAAGMGSRYGGLKQIDPVGRQGEFILDYSIYDAIQAGFDKVVFIIKEENLALFRDTVGKRVEKVIPVEYVFQKVTDLLAGMVAPAERTKPWGTAHAVLCCADVVKDNFAVINADDFYGRHSYELMADFLKNRNNTGIEHYSMIGYMLRNTLTEHGHVARGLCEVDNGFLKGIDERTKIQRNNGVIQYFEEADGWVDVKEDTAASMNFWGFGVSIFDQIANYWDEYIKESASNPTKAEFYIPVLVKKLLSAKKCDVKVIETTDKWQGVTYASDKPAVVEYIKKLTEAGEYPVGLWS